MLARSPRRRKMRCSMSAKLPTEAARCGGFDSVFKRRFIAEFLRFAAGLIHLAQDLVAAQIDAFFLEQQFTVDLFPCIELALRLLHVGDGSFERIIEIFLAGFQFFFFRTERRDTFFEVREIFRRLLELTAQRVRHRPAASALALLLLRCAARLFPQVRT